MNRDAVIKTAITRWSPEEGCYVTESHLAETISGSGDTPAQAHQVFVEMVEMNYQAYKEGKHALYNRPGRPKKGKVALRAEVNPKIKDEISNLAKEFGISQGETVEYLLRQYEAHQSMQELQPC